MPPGLTLWPKKGAPVETGPARSIATELLPAPLGPLSSAKPERGRSFLTRYCLGSAFESSPSHSTANARLSASRREMGVDVEAMVAAAGCTVGECPAVRRGEIVERAEAQAAGRRAAARIWRQEGLKVPPASRSRAGSGPVTGPAPGFEPNDPTMSGPTTAWRIAPMTDESIAG